MISFIDLQTIIINMIRPVTILKLEKFELCIKKLEVIGHVTAEKIKQIKQQKFINDDENNIQKKIRCSDKFEYDNTCYFKLKKYDNKLNLSTYITHFNNSKYKNIFQNNYLFFIIPIKKEIDVVPATDYPYELKTVYIFQMCIASNIYNNYRFFEKYNLDKIFDSSSKIDNSKLFFTTNEKIYDIILKEIKKQEKNLLKEL